MKRNYATIYALFCTLLMVAGFASVFFFAWQRGIYPTVACLCGLILGFVFAPVVHELGHVVCAKTADMECVYWKAFCFQVLYKKGKMRLRFASPFAPEQTQVLPKSSGNMQKRGARYALGGLYFGGGFFLVAALLAIITGNFILWGVLPYAGYLFLLNVAPVEYASGKTDTLVYRGMKKGYPAETCMLSAMEIQGQLSEGKSFGEIDRGYYYDLPALREDESIFALLLDLRYRYHLDRGEIEEATKQLNRLASLEGYLSEQEMQKISAEFVYMHALNADMGASDACGQGCKEYLAGESATAKRILAAYCFAFGKEEAVEPLKAQARLVMKSEPLGVQKFEEKLLSRINTKENGDT